ncbi:WD40-repeat-containing domain protein [Xylaria sp. CBS 124048]|nr:WD40-repeat-containing domain protein [Xylaria sp. CBS 124048]
MLCALSGEAPQEPVVSKLSGSVFEKRLIEKYIEENGKDPVSGEDLTVEDLLPIKTARVVHPRPPALTSIPALLTTFQNEWDALALETYNLKEQLLRTREELATALYQHDAAIRVIARLTRERDEARDALSRVSVSAGGGGGGGGASEDDAMAVDNEGLSEDLIAKIDETQARLSKSRKKRPVPKDWATPDQIATFTLESSSHLPIAKPTTLSFEAGYAAVGGLEGEVSVYSVEAGSVERSITVGEPVTDSIWEGSRVYFSTAKGSVKVFDSGSEIASFTDHAGAATGLAMHPSKAILASVGADKSFVFYDLDTLQKATRVYTNAALTTCAFHPDGHLFAAGTDTGDIKLYMTNGCQEAATFSLGAPIQALAFSENGFWFAATAKGQTTVTIFDLRKSGEAAHAKVLDIGSAVQHLAWDYSQQFLATAGQAGVTVQQYSKGAKSWSEPLRAAVSNAVDVAWGENAGKLLIVNSEGVITVLGAEES